MGGMGNPWRRVLIATLVVSFLLAVAAAPCEASGCQWGEPERQMYGLINRARSAHGLDELRCYNPAIPWAHTWSRHMADENLLHHSDLSFPKPKSWSVAGENVGVGGTARSLHKAFMASPGHRANILNKVFDWVSIGFIRRDGTAWVTVDFVG